MKLSTAIGAAALLALAAAATTADARIMAGTSMSTHMTSGSNLSGMSSRLDQSSGPRHLRKFNDDQPDDPPPKKTPTGSTGSGSGSGSGTNNPYGGPYHAGGYWDARGHWHPTGDVSGLPLKCRYHPC